MLDQYWVEIDLLQYKQQINIAKVIPIPIPILVPTLFSSFLQFFYSSILVKCNLQSYKELFYLPRQRSR